MYGSNAFLVVAKYFLCLIIHEIAKCDKTRDFPPKFRARLKDFVGAPLPRSKGISHPAWTSPLLVKPDEVATNRF